MDSKLTWNQNGGPRQGNKNVGICEKVKEQKQRNAVCEWKNDLCHTLFFLVSEGICVYGQKS